MKNKEVFRKYSKKEVGYLSCNSFSFFLIRLSDFLGLTRWNFVRWSLTGIGLELFGDILLMVLVEKVLRQSDTGIG